MTSPTHLVAIRRSGSRTPLYLIHSLAGELTWMPALARDLDPERPLYGFAAPGLNSDAPFFSTLEEMAAAYLRDVRAAQAHGPYILGGYSFGGVLAFEMTRQLQAVGESVDMLILLDAFVPNGRLARLFATWNDKGILLQVVTNLLGLQWKASALLPAGVLPVGDSKAQSEVAARHLLACCKIPHSLEALQSYLQRCQAVMRAHTNLLSEYCPRPLSGNVRTLLFHNTLGLVGRASALLLPVPPEEDRNPEHGWDGLLTAPALKIGVPAEHFMIGRSPALDFFVRSLQDQLAAAENSRIQHSG
jgi:thioesterase domain-containing protein